MRVEFAQAVINEYISHKNILFLTGDLGFMALEKVQETFGEKFINMGIAEQNMITMAASLAHEGFVPFVYSISPFVTLRPYEQIRNDVCLHNLPVKIVGNGGGYGYGIMGSTHHNIEDIGAMRILPNMKVYVPVTSQDVFDVVGLMIQDPSPNYLRLNMTAAIPDLPKFAPWRKFKSGSKLIIIGTGPILENLYKLSIELFEQIEIWSVGIFPMEEIPVELIRKIDQIRNVLTIEEHKGQCGLNEAVASLILKKCSTSIIFDSIYANGYISGKYGNQTFHQEENDLAGSGLLSRIQKALNNII